MLFNSFEFIVFLPIVYILYWFVFQKDLRLQNALILLASYVFYGWWDYRFLSLIAVSTLVDYYVGQKVYSSQTKVQRKIWMWCSVIFNLGLLGFFKYYNFFTESLVEALANMGYSMDPWTLQIILPVGISFYTFQTMSYTLDIYRGNLRPTTNLLAFGAFVSFFPQLVAGPIERASNLLPQVLRQRKFNYAQSVEGLRLILWGMFKKVVIADSLAPVVNDIFANYLHYDGGVLALGAIYFGVQIYCDFSGYSNIARGLAKLLGFELMVNFNFPYFSRNIGQFWRRWHISLSTWFRDYVYIPLGGSRVGSLKAIRNIFVIFIVSGFWHGADWRFIIWGGIHAMLFIPSFIRGTNRKPFEGHILSQGFINTTRNILAVVITYTMVTIAWIFFRADSTTIALDYIHRLFTELNLPSQYRIFLLKFVYPVFLLESLNFSTRAKNWFNKYRLLRFAVYYILLFAILLSYSNSVQDFIYFQF